MTVLDRPTALFSDYSITSGAAHAPMGPNSSIPRPEQSDPYVKWAVNFHQGLNRAAAKVRSWARDPESLADDGLTPPSSKSLHKTIELIEALKTTVMDRVPPSQAKLLNLKGISLGCGGEISIEMLAGKFAQTYRVDQHGSVTELIFINNRLLVRRSH